MSQETPKGLIVSVFESKSEGNCSANGISSKYKRLILLPNETHPKIPKIFDAENLDEYIVIKTKNHVDRTYYYATKAFETDEDKKRAGPMFGGQFIYTSDSRFPHDYPISIHDRYEEQN